MTRQVPDPFRDPLLAAVPHLRAVARALCRHADRADDLVQETLLRAWEARHDLHDPTRLKPWLLTILRRIYYRTLAKRRTEVEDVDGVHAAALVADPVQSTLLELEDVMGAFERLPVEQREALALVCIEELSYEEAAGICGCAVGTIKSRISRARAGLERGSGIAADRRLAAPAARGAALPANLRPSQRRPSPIPPHHARL